MQAIPNGEYLSVEMLAMIKTLRGYVFD